MNGVDEVAVKLVKADKPTHKEMSLFHKEVCYPAQFSHMNSKASLAMTIGMDGSSRKEFSRAARRDCDRTIERAIENAVVAVRRC